MYTFGNTTLILLIGKHVLRVLCFGMIKKGSLIQDHLDHGASKEPKNPFQEWIHWFL